MLPYNSSSSYNPSQDPDPQLQNLFAGEASAPEPTFDVDATKMAQTEDRKILHRELERERRKQMATSLSHLRSLLPLNFVKGKRSKEGLVDEAVNYIKHLERRIGELHMKRDALKRVLNRSCNVVVNSYSDALEIVISCVGEDDLQLSRVMEVLLDEDIHVDCSASTRANERIFHTIQSKVIDSTRKSVNVPELQQKLHQFCNSGPLW